MLHSGICERPSCGKFKQSDCGYECEQGKHCDGYSWNRNYPIDPNEMEKPVLKQERGK